MPVRSSDARWEGSIGDGKGTMALGSGAWAGAYSVPTRFEDAEGTNPEELIAAAHAGCYSMALSGDLGRAGYDPESVETTATVQLDKVENGFKISHIQLDSEARVPGIEETEFQEIAEGAKQGCPVSQALQAVDMDVTATLAS